MNEERPGAPGAEEEERADVAQAPPEPVLGASDAPRERVDEPEAPPHRESPEFAEESADEFAGDEQTAAEAGPEIGPLPDIGVEDLSTTTVRRKRRLTSWVGKGAKKVVSKIYETSAADLEERARRAVGSAYRDQADDLEERAVRAMRQAIRNEADKIKEAVEHGIEVKRREVRLSLVVLLIASLVYLLLFWLTRSGVAPA